MQPIASIQKVLWRRCRVGLIATTGNVTLDKGTETALFMLFVDDTNSIRRRHVNGNYLSHLRNLMHWGLRQQEPGQTRPQRKKCPS